MPGRGFSILLLLLFLTRLTTAQSTTGISGNVFDGQGKPVVGANIFILDSYDGATSGEEGLFSFEATITGEQMLMISHLGYKDNKIPVFLEGSPLKLTVTLSAGALELEGIVITAGVYEASGESRREVLKPLDIVSTAGATADLIGVFNTLPGTQVVGEEGRLFVRGGEADESKTFIDGMQVRNLYSPTAPNTPSRSRFLPFMFSGASFSTGGYSAEFGQALSSVLILQSKPVAALSRMDISLMSVGVDAGFTRAWKNSSLSGKLQYTNIDPYFSLIGQEIDWADPPTSYESSFAYRKNLGNTGIFKLYGIGTYSAFSLNRFSLDNPQEPVPTDIRNGYVYLNAVIHDETKSGWTLKTGASLTSNKDWLGVAQSDIDQLDVGFHGKIVMEKSLTDVIGLKFGSEYFRTAVSEGISDPGQVHAKSHGYTSNLSALFAESDIRISEKLITRIGIRSAYSALNNRINLGPRISLAYKAGANSQVSGAFGKFHQEPSPQLLLEESRLRHEKAMHYILNYQFTKEARTFRIEAYYKNYGKLIRYDTRNDGSPGAISNTGSGFAKGIDLFWRDNRTIRGGDYWLSYSYLDTRRHYRDFPYPAVPAFASKHNFSLVYKHFISAVKSQVGATFRYTSGRPYNNPNLAGFQNRSTKDYLDLSLNISYLITQQIILHASATNVLGRDNIFGYEFASTPDENGVFDSRAIRPPAPRFLFIGLFITFSEENTFNQLPNL